MVVAVMSALAQEQEGLLALMHNVQSGAHAGRTFYTGVLQGQPVVLALSRIGKVAAATTTAALIEHYGVKEIIFTGVAGGVGPSVHIGDVVVGDSYLQHDMDASPIFPRYQIPLTGQSTFAADAAVLARLKNAAQQALAQRRFADRAVAVHCGLIASGDQFLSGPEAQAQLLAGLHAHGYSPLAVEMEGAAVAQTCADYGVPFAAVRTISDRADAGAAEDFTAFVEHTARHYAQAIVLHYLTQRSDQLERV